MCGIAGFIDSNKYYSGSPTHIRKMTSTLTHRGPDDEGVWIDSQIGVALGHRRLSIIDLSQQGHQPMISASERYVIAYNGEIYNFKKIRQELDQINFESKQNIRWRGHSDTEVILTAIEQWGLEKAAERFNGMFAFALWDRNMRLLHLVRDRLGKKPLYYGWQGKSFVFGSELKALKPYPDFQGEIDRNVLLLLFRYGYIPGPYSIYEGINKLKPGVILTLKSDDLFSDPMQQNYWSLKEVAERSITTPFKGTEDEAVEHFDGLLRDAIRLRMISDVPVGAFLSGGIDSSAVVALMQTISQQPVKTFTLGFSDDAYNEATHAKEIAKYLRTDHTELYVTPKQVLDVIPQLPKLYDEPFADSSQVPTFLVSQLARNQLKVCLSGDGGDEIFGGYNNYNYIWKLHEKIKSFANLPTFAGKSLQKAFSLDRLKRLELFFGKLGPGKFKKLKNKLKTFEAIFFCKTPEEYFLWELSSKKDLSSLVVGAIEPLTVYTNKSQWVNMPDIIQGTMLLDSLCYLPDNGLTKVDRASMGVGLEVRIPLLDHRIVDFAWKIPLSMKIRSHNRKWILRQVLYKYVPKELIEKPKKGFTMPTKHWLRGPLRDWAEDLLDERRLKEEGYLNPGPVRSMWSNHLSGKSSLGNIWNILMFQLWLQHEKTN